MKYFTAMACGLAGLLAVTTGSAGASAFQGAPAFGAASLASVAPGYVGMQADVSSIAMTSVEPPERGRFRCFFRGRFCG